MANLMGICNQARSQGGFRVARKPPPPHGHHHMRFFYMCAHACCVCFCVVQVPYPGPGVHVLSALRPVPVNRLEHHFARVTTAPAPKRLLIESHPDSTHFTRPP